MLGSFGLQISENIKGLFGDYEIYDLLTFRLTLIHTYLIMAAHWIFISQYLKTSIILPLMLENARGLNGALHTV